MILVSPGAQLPPSAVQLAEMEKLSPHDPMLAPEFFKNCAFLGMKPHDEWLRSPVLFDLSGFPPIDLYYGTHEIMYAYLPAMQAALEKAEIRYRLHIGEGLCHCWPLLGFTREGKAARREICGFIKQAAVEKQKRHGEKA
jgi:acetyl esterase/lipase